MIRNLTAILSVTIGLAASSALIGQSTADNGKRPLDLPAGKIGRDEEDEEDETESIIFYGYEYEADAFFWCLDKSGSMIGAQLQTLKQEVTSVVGTLTNRAEFGLVSFSNGHTSWNPQPVKATVANKASAIAWVQGLIAEGGTCMAPAAVTAVNISNMCRLRHKAIIIVSDGEPNCPGCSETVLAVTQANWQRTSVNTLFIGGDAGGASCMQQIAAANSGSSSQVN